MGNANKPACLIDIAAIRNEVKQMKLKVNTVSKIEDGLHTGVILLIEYRTEPYEYTDVVIEVEGMRIKVGYPTFVSPESKLGKLLMRFGANPLPVGGIIEPETFLVGKKCKLQTLNEIKGDKSYARIIPESVKPFEVPK